MRVSTYRAEKRTVAAHVNNRELRDIASSK
jgi:hypothetical protein